MLVEKYSGSRVVLLRFQIVCARGPVLDIKKKKKKAQSKAWRTTAARPAVIPQRPQRRGNPLAIPYHFMSCSLDVIQADIIPVHLHSCSFISETVS